MGCPLLREIEDSREYPVSSKEYERIRWVLTALYLLFTY